MQRLILGSLFVLVACGSSGSDDSSGDDVAPIDGNGGGSGQHVLECSGVVVSGEPSNCPHGDCNEGNGDLCTAYANVIPGSTSGLCNAGESGSYGLQFGTSPGSLSDQFYEVVVCSNGTATLHPCSSGYSTTTDGYDGQPGYVCQ